jgi:regulator of sigma E protease
VVRAGETFAVDVVPDDDGGRGKIGIGLAFPSVVQRLPPLAAISAGVGESRRMTRETFRVIGKLLTRKASIRQVSGPVDIARISGEAARSGLHTLIWLMGLISLQLGIFNLLPIPILDGGHLTIIAFESLVRRDLSIRVKERILEVGFYLLILLMVVVLFNDIVKILPDRVYRLFSGG